MNRSKRPLAHWAPEYCTLSRFCAIAAMVLLISLASMSGAWGQVLYGVLVGNLTDSSGGTVAGASVQATNQGTNITTTATSDESGHFLFNNLAPGTYSVTVTSPTLRRRRWKE